MITLVSPELRDVVVLSRRPAVRLLEGHDKASLSLHNADLFFLGRDDSYFFADGGPATILGVGVDPVGESSLVLGKMVPQDR